LEGAGERDMGELSTVLIVDDDVAGQEALEATLTGQGYELLYASSGPEALAMAGHCLPDVILLDVMMPGMDGFEVCRRLRSDPALAEVPVVMITALDDRQALLDGLGAGADDFISKPFDRLEVRARVRTTVRLNRFHRLLEERANVQALMEQAQDGYVIVGADDKLLYANAPAKQYLGLPLNAPLHADLHFMVQVVEMYSREPEYLWAGWPTPSTSADSPLYLIRPESADRAGLWLAVECLDPPGGSVTKHLICLRDVTAKITAQQNLWSFHFSIMHKLSTPLSLVVTSLELLTLKEAEFSRPNMLSLISTAHRNSLRLQTAIQDVLEYLELPRLAESPEGYSLDRLPVAIAQAVAELGLDNVDLDLPSPLAQCCLPLAAHAVELIVRELLVNAQKFHPSHRPSVKITTFQPNTDQIGLRIVDDAIGVPPEKLSWIWSPYYQVERNFTGQVPGMGLGLSMVATLIWGVGGTCTANNRSDGPGLVVELVLPGLAASG
jgi:two-component system cell cycle response regulator